MAFFPLFFCSFCLLCFFPFSLPLNSLSSLSTACFHHFPPPPASTPPPSLFCAIKILRITLGCTTAAAELKDLTSANLHINRMCYCVEQIELLLLSISETEMALCSNKPVCASHPPVAWLSIFIPKSLLRRVVFLQTRPVGIISLIKPQHKVILSCTRQIFVLIVQFS